MFFVLFQSYSLHSHPYSSHFHPDSPHSHPDSLHSHSNSLHSHWFPIPAFTESLLIISKSIEFELCVMKLTTVKVLIRWWKSIQVNDSAIIDVTGVQQLMSQKCNNFLVFHIVEVTGNYCSTVWYNELLNQTSKWKIYYNMK